MSFDITIPEHKKKDFKHISDKVYDLSKTSINKSIKFVRDHDSFSMINRGVSRIAVEVERGSITNNEDYWDCPNGYCLKVPLFSQQAYSDGKFQNKIAVETYNEELSEEQRKFFSPVIDNYKDSWVLFPYMDSLDPGDDVDSFIKKVKNEVNICDLDDEDNVLKYKGDLYVIDMGQGVFSF